MELNGDALLLYRYSRQEIREYLNKAVAKEYFYIDYRRAIDAIKYRIHMIDNKIKSLGKASAEKKDLHCTRCDSEYTHIEVLDSIDPRGRGSGFLCKKCGNLLTLRKVADVEEESDGMPALFNKQFGTIISLLHQIDNITVQASNPEELVAEARPLQRENTMYKSSQGTKPGMVRPSAVKGITSGPEKIEVSFSTTTETYAAEKAADIERRARLAEQNQLPEWHTKSTITGDGQAVAVIKDTVHSEQETPAASQSNADEEERDKGRDPALDAYFAALRAEQEVQANKRSDDDDDDEEDDDDDDDDENEDFEDVVKSTAEESNKDGGISAESGEKGNNVVTATSAEIPKSTDKTETPKHEIIADGESDEDDFEDAL